MYLINIENAVLQRDVRVVGDGRSVVRRATSAIRVQDNDKLIGLAKFPLNTPSFNVLLHNLQGDRLYLKGSMKWFRFLTSITV